MARGFGYLVAIIDLLSRKVLAHRLSNRMTADFCIAALQGALARFGTPEIFNPTRGAQLTDTDFTHTLSAHGIAIHMDGKGRCIDNVFSERLWRSVKYEASTCAPTSRWPRRGAGWRRTSRCTSRPPASESRVPHPGRGVLHCPGGGRKQGCVN
jgi:transposase InsO family protein